MKTILSLSGRMLAILVAALLVIGVTMSFVDTDAAQLPPDRSAVLQRGDAANLTASTESDATQSGTMSAENAASAPHRESHGPENQSLGARLAFGLFGLLQNFAIIGVIVLSVVWLERRFTRQPAKTVA